MTPGNRIFRFIALSGLVLLVAGSCSVKVEQVRNAYYIDPSGSDENPGTLSSPFQSIRALDSIKIDPGDTIFFQGDHTFSGTLQLKLNGAADQPIVLTSYGRGKVVIDGNNNEAGLLSGKHFVINNMEFRGSGRKSGNTTSGFVVQDAFDVDILDVKCSGFQKSGLLVQNSSNVSVSKVHASDNGAIGISIRNSNNCIVRDCLAKNNPGDPTNLTNHSGNGILVGGSKNVLIDRCVATNNGWDMPRIGNGPVGIWAYQTDSIIIQYCIAYRNKTSKGAKDGGGFDFDGGVTNSVIQYCLSYENEGAGYGLFQYPGANLWSNNFIRYNLSINDGIVTDGAGGIFIWNGGESASEVSDCFIHNNIVYNEKKPAVVFEPASEHVNFNFNNNIFIGSGNIVEGPSSGDKFQGNVWWHVPAAKIRFRNHKDLETWAKQTGQEMIDGQLIGLQADPMLKGPMIPNITDPYELEQLFGYQLQESSPVIDRGLDIRKIHQIELPDHDFFGRRLVLEDIPEPGIHAFSE